MARVCPKPCSRLAIAAVFISVGVVQLLVGVMLLRSSHAAVLSGPDFLTASANIAVGCAFGITASIWKINRKRTTLKYIARRNVLASLLVSAILVNATAALVLIAGDGNALLARHLQMDSQFDSSPSSFVNQVLASAYVTSVCSPIVCIVVAIVSLSANCFQDSERGGSVTKQNGVTELDRTVSWVYDSKPSATSTGDPFETPTTPSGSLCSDSDTSVFSSDRVCVTDPQLPRKSAFLISNSPLHTWTQKLTKNRSHRRVLFRDACSEGKFCKLRQPCTPARDYVGLPICQDPRSTAGLPINQDPKSTAGIRVNQEPRSTAGFSQVSTRSKSYSDQGLIPKTSLLGNRGGKKNEYSKGKYEFYQCKKGQISERHYSVGSPKTQDPRRANYRSGSVDSAHRKSERGHRTSARLKWASFPDSYVEVHKNKDEIASKDVSNKYKNRPYVMPRSEIDRQSSSDNDTMSENRENCTMARLKAATLQELKHRVTCIPQREFHDADAQYTLDATQQSSKLSFNDLKDNIITGKEPQCTSRAFNCYSGNISEHCRSCSHLKSPSESDLDSFRSATKIPVYPNPEDCRGRVVPENTVPCGSNVPTSAEGPVFKSPIVCARNQKTELISKISYPDKFRAAPTRNRMSSIAESTEDEAVTHTLNASWDGTTPRDRTPDQPGHVRWPRSMSEKSKAPSVQKSSTNSMLKSFLKKRWSCRVTDKLDLSDLIVDPDSLIGLTEEELIERTMRIRSLRKAIGERVKEESASRKSTKDEDGRI